MNLDRPKLEAQLKENVMGCPWCAGEAWAPAGESAMLIRAGDLPTSDQFTFLNVFPVKCLKCGYVILFDGHQYAVE